MVEQIAARNAHNQYSQWLDKQALRMSSLTKGSHTMNALWGCISRGNLVQ